MEAAPTILKVKKGNCRCEGDVLEREDTAWLKRNPMCSERSKLLCLIIFLLPPTLDQLPPLHVQDLNHCRQFLSGSQLSDQGTAPAGGTDGVCEMLPQIQTGTSCWKTFCRRDTAGTRVWWQGQLLPPLPAASDCTLGKGMNPEMEKHIEDTEHDLKFIFGVIVSTSLLHFWSFPPCLVVFYSVGFSQFFVLWGFQAGFSL